MTWTKCTHTYIESRPVTYIYIIESTHKHKCESFALNKHHLLGFKISVIPLTFTCTHLALQQIVKGELPNLYDEPLVTTTCCFETRNDIIELIESLKALQAEIKINSFVSTQQWGHNTHHSSYKLMGASISNYICWQKWVTHKRLLELSSSKWLWNQPCK